jgi:superfamily II DNA/RNA helicase
LIQRSTQGRENVTRLLNDSISTDVSSALLFLIAGYTGDATEVAERLSFVDQPPVLRELIEALALLSRGRLYEITEMEIPRGSFDFNDPFVCDSIATIELYKEILLGVKQLANELLGFATANANVTFKRVMNLAVAKIEINDIERVETTILNTYSGPHHLASLLVQVADTLISSSVLKISPPDGVNTDRWSSFVRDLASRRPYLWGNHRNAISAGYLVPGVSSAVSFPTGAGKSTVSELKIASTLLAGGKVLFLVPTHALVSQVYRDLKKTFPSADIRGTALVDGEYSETEEMVLPDIVVLTPERCLTQLGIEPDVFAQLRLVVFDECHLLHPKERLTDQRSLDAMFCILGLFQNARQSDFVFLSAMMKNTSEISGWITSATGRPCLALDLDWKPTRQVRGCVIYDQNKLAGLQNLLESRKKDAMKPAFKNFTNWTQSGRKGKRPKYPAVPKAADKKDLEIEPKVLFCLKQMWAGNDFDDYMVVPFLTRSIELKVSDNWNLTANRNGVAKEIACNFANLGVKTLVFAQNRTWAAKISSEVAEELQERPDFSFTEQEKRWLEISTLEAGGESHVYQPLNNVSACHHSLLMPSERLLNESAFTRLDGIPVLAATPTLAQGINLPAEVVIMAGDDRFDQDTGYNSPLHAHELLNAAGRAGRAGYVSNGVVLIIPGSNVGLDLDKVTLSQRWFDLKESFSNPDKCLDIEDPIDVFLDLLQAEIASEDKAAVEYFLTRLPFGTNDEPAKQMLTRTLAAYKASHDDKATQFQIKISKAISARNELIEIDEDTTWLSELSSSTGLPTRFISDLSEAIGQLTGLKKTVVEWIDWYFDWLELDVFRANTIISPVTFEEISKAGRKLKDKRDHDESLTLLRDVTKLWVSGATLAVLEQKLETPMEKIGFCDLARKCTTQWLRNVSYGMGLIAQILRKNDSQNNIQIPIELSVLASCVKEGFDSYLLLALSHVLPEPHARTEIAKLFDALKCNLPDGDPHESFGQAKHRVGNAHRLTKVQSDFSDF